MVRAPAARCCSSTTCFTSSGSRSTRSSRPPPATPDGVLNATAPLRGVYKNLTDDDSDPFPFFKQLLDVAYPENQVSSIPGTNPDDPWPLASFQYWGVKNTFGKDEVSDLICLIRRLVRQRLLARARRVQPPGARRCNTGDTDDLVRRHHLPAIGGADRDLPVRGPEDSAASPLQLRRAFRRRPRSARSPRPARRPNPAMHPSACWARRSRRRRSSSSLPARIPTSPTCCRTRRIRRSRTRRG